MPTPFWIRTLLGVPLELKLLGTNLIIMAVAVLLLFGPIRLEPTHLADTIVVIGALALGSAVSFVLVRVALRPINSLAQVAWLVSQGVLGARVPPSMMADRELKQLAATINELLDDLVLERNRIARLHPQAAAIEGRRERSARGMDTRLISFRSLS